MKETLKIEGMTCDHCVMHVTNALEAIDGVEKAKVSLKKNEALVKFSAQQIWIKWLLPLQRLVIK